MSDRAIDRRPQPCTHPRAKHQHGTHLAYAKDRCRCTPCTRANAKHWKRTDYRTITGTHSYVDAGPAREHVRNLLEVLTFGQIEARSGVHRTAIRVLMGDIASRPPSKRITRKTAAALLAVTAVRVGPETSGWVDATGTVRRLQALAAIGWPFSHIAERLSMSSLTTWKLTSPNAPRPVAPVLAVTRAQVKELYDELSMRVPPAGRYATRTRKLAASRGWAPPLAWDDDTIDDPAEAPDLGEPTPRRSGRPTADLDEWMYLVSTGESMDRAAQRCGVKLDAIEQAALRHGRRDVLDAVIRGRAAAA